MKPVLKNYLLIIAVLLSIASSAQQSMQFSLQSAIDYALNNNTQMRNANLSILESKYKHRETIASGLPQIDLKADYQNFFNSSASIGQMEFVFNPTSNANLQVGQLIFNGNYIIGIQMASLYREMTEVNAKKTEADIKTQVRNVYSMVLLTEETKKIITSNLSNLKEVTEKTRVLVDVGMLEETDFDQISVQIGMLENTLKTVERQNELALNLFRLQLGLGSKQEVVLTENLNDLLIRAALEGSMDESFTIEKTIDYQLLQIQKNLSKKSVTMEKMNYLPNVVAFYSYTEKIKKAELDFAPKHVIGLNVSIPIFSGGSRHYKHQQAKVNYLITQNNVEFFTEQIIMQEKQLRYNLKNSYEQFELQKKNIEVSKRVYNNIYLKYQQGMVSSIDLTTANSNYLQAENNYISAVMQLLESKNELDKLLNK